MVYVFLVFGLIGGFFICLWIFNNWRRWKYLKHFQERFKG
jgi:uncharacterized protein YneF (UPF0154 family)